MDGALNNSGERFQKDAVSVSGFTGFIGRYVVGRKVDSHKKICEKICSFSYFRIRVNVAQHEINLVFKCFMPKEVD